MADDLKSIVATSVDGPMPENPTGSLEEAELIKKKVVEKTFSGVEFETHTYSVFPTNGSGDKLRGGPDDQTLSKHPVLAKHIVRGCSDLFHKKCFVAKVRGPPKFFGEVPGADEDEEPFEGATDEDIANAKVVIDMPTIIGWQKAGELEVQFQEKANGKFAIVTVFFLDDKPWVFGGSKNVHVPVPLDVDLDTLPHDLHYNILRLMIPDIRKTSDIKSLVGRQIVGEYCDGKHLCWAPEVYMVYFDNTLPDNFRKPIDVIPSMAVVPGADVYTQVRRMRNIEGVVIKFWNIRTGETLWQKLKTVEYVIKRCWREIISKKNKETILPPALIRLLISRMQSRSDQFLHMSVEELAEWSATAEVFVSRLTKSRYAYKDVSPFSEVGMARIWEELMSANYVAPSVAPVADIPIVKKLEIKDILAIPKYYECVLAAAELQPVLVIMQGLPGSGKSTVARQLVEDLAELKHDASVFSTDDFFTVDGVYRFNPKLLGVNHGKNLEAACASRARVVIVDNTNLIPAEYAKYKSGMSDRIVIVLSCKETDPAILSRNTHGVPVEHLGKMAAKYKVAAPSYIGGFPSLDAMTPWKQLTTQAAPAHLTELFIGGDIRKMAHFDMSTLCQTYPFKVVGVSTVAPGTGLGGIGLVCEADIRSESTPHITLATNADSKPMHVGQQIKPENTVPCEPITLTAVRLPMF
jgi:hypothetical protein